VGHVAHSVGVDEPGPVRNLVSADRVAFELVVGVDEPGPVRNLALANHVAFELVGYVAHSVGVDKPGPVRNLVSANRVAFELVVGVDELPGPVCNLALANHIAFELVGYVAHGVGVDEPVPVRNLGWLIVSWSSWWVTWQSTNASMSRGPFKTSCWLITSCSSWWVTWLLVEAQGMRIREQDPSPSLSPVGQSRGGTMNSRNGWW